MEEMKVSECLQCIDFAVHETTGTKIVLQQSGIVQLTLDLQELQKKEKNRSCLKKHCWHDVSPFKCFCYEYKRERDY